MPPRFLIKHKSAGKYLHPYSGENEPKLLTPVVFAPNTHKYMEWEFETVDGYWGYIRHAKSNYVIHPIDGSLSPQEGTQLVLSESRHAGALFALDSVNHMIVHKGGLKVHPKGDSPYPVDHEKFVLGKSENAAMEFLFVKPENPKEQVLVYGKPKIDGSWKIINMVLNPLADHTDTIQVKVGEVKKLEFESSIKLSYETHLGIKAGPFEFGEKISFEAMMKLACSSTWSEEITSTRSIVVKPGNSVVTWQFVFELNHRECNRQRIFRSNFLADTTSEDEPPRELKGGMPTDRT